MSIENINDFISIIGENTCEFVTSDGGIDYSNNYNLQELSSYNLIFFEIYLMIFSNFVVLRGDACLNLTFEKFF